MDAPIQGWIASAVGSTINPRRRRLGEVVAINFSTTVGTMGGLALIPLAKAHREASGLQAGQAIHVVLELDTAPPGIDVPSELSSALAAAGLTAVFDKLAPARRKEFARQIVDAKTEETKARRIANVIAQLSE